MTSHLTSLIANAVRQEPASVANAAGQSTLANQAAGNQVALSQAVALANAARVTVARLPEHILAIRTPSSTSQSLNIKVPVEVTQQAHQNPQLAVLPNNNIGDKNVPAILSATTNTTHQIELPHAERGALFKALMQALESGSSTASVNGKLVTLANGQFAIDTNNKRLPNSSSNVSSATLSAQTQGAIALSISSAEQKALLQKWLGSHVTLTLANGTNSGASTLQATLSPTSANTLDAQNRTQPLRLSNMTGATHTQVIEAALKQGTVALESKSLNSTSLKFFLPSDITQTPNILKSAALIGISDNAGKTRDGVITIQSAHHRALVSIALSQTQAQALPVLDNKQVAQIDQALLPKATLIYGKTPLENPSLQQQDGVNKHAATAVSPASLKDSDVHHAIMTLSRVLLSQTGNTQHALSQLLSIVEGTSNSAVNPPPNATASPTEKLAIEKLLQQLKSLDVLNAKPSTRQVLNMGSKTQNTNTSTVATNSLQRDSAHQPEQQKTETTAKHDLAALAKLLGNQAKAASNSLLSNALQQLTGTGTKINVTSSVMADVEQKLQSPAQGSVSGEQIASSKPTMELAEQGLSQRIQQVFTANALLMTPLTLTSPVASSSFVQGLVTLVQLALAGRAIQRQPSLKSLADAPDSIISKTLTNMGVPGQPSKVSQELNQLDSRHQLLSQLKTLLASHQQAKLASAESRIQGQDSLYYVFPSLSQQHSPTELLVQREQEKPNQARQEKGERKLWNVTMKLDIGSTGAVLAKSKIDNDTITLDLYASNDVILKRLADTLPYLKKRLTELGLTVEQTTFQRGHIPESLNTRPHQIFETRV